MTMKRKVGWFLIGFFGIVTVLQAIPWIVLSQGTGVFIFDVKLLATLIPVLIGLYLKPWEKVEVNGRKR